MELEHDKCRKPLCCTAALKRVSAMVQQHALQGVRGYTMQGSAGCHCSRPFRTAQRTVLSVLQLSPAPHSCTSYKATQACNVHKPACICAGAACSVRFASVTRFPRSMSAMEAQHCLQGVRGYTMQAGCHCCHTLLE